MKLFIYLFIALFLILIFGLNMFGIIIGLGLLGAIGNGIIAAKRQADEQKKVEEENLKRNEEMHRWLKETYGYK